MSAIRLSIGEPVWERALDANQVIYSQGRVIALGDHVFAALDAATGKVLWQKAFGVYPAKVSVVAHGHLYVKPANEPGGSKDRIISVDPTSGKQLWAALAGNDWQIGQMAATADALVVTAREIQSPYQYYLLILDPANGAIKYRLAVGKDYGVNRIALAGEQVYVFTDVLRVYGPAQPLK